MHDLMKQSSQKKKGGKVSNVDVSSKQMDGICLDTKNVYPRGTLLWHKYTTVA